MAQRIYREQPQYVKDKISNSMKLYHANKTETDKQKTRNAQAASMRIYWTSIPNRPNDNSNNLF